MSLEIPLPLLLGVVVGGVALVVALTHIVGWSEQARLDEDLARERYGQDHPQAVIRAVRAADDGAVALLELSDGVGLVYVLGDRLVTRRLTRDTLRAVDGLDHGLRLRLADSSRPRLVVRLEDPEVRRAWRGRLAALTQEAA